LVGEFGLIEDPIIPWRIYYCTSLFFFGGWMVKYYLESGDIWFLIMGITFIIIGVFLLGSGIRRMIDTLKRTSKYRGRV